MGMDTETAKKGMLVWGRSQRAALDGDVDTAADLLGHAGRTLVEAGDWMDAARVYIDLALISVEIADPARQRESLTTAMRLLERDASPRSQRALSLLGNAVRQEPPQMSMVGLVRAKLLPLDTAAAMA